MKKDSFIFLNNMLECVDAILSYAHGMTKDDFIRDSRTKDAICMRLLALGESATVLLKSYPDMEQQHPHIPWRDVCGMRNIIAHEHFGIDYNTVWITVIQHIPVPKEKLEVLMKNH